MRVTVYSTVLRRYLAQSVPVVVAALALGMAAPVTADDDDDHRRKGATILEMLESTDGSQALVAAIRMVSQTEFSHPCAVNIEQLLDDRSERLVFFAPGNLAFERFFTLPEGGFDGMNSDVIELLLPGLLNKIELTDVDVCDVLLKHVAETRSARWLSASRLLLRGDITVANGSKFAIAVGRVGPSINYEASITERDVFTVNGVIHYIDSVIVEPEPEPPVDPGLICLTVDRCEAPGPSREDCLVFVALCDGSGQDQEDCAQGATLICLETRIGPGP